MRAVLMLAALVALTGCDGESKDGDGGEDTSAGGGDTTGGGGGGDGVEGTIPALRVTGTVTWTLDFDAEAESSGLFDCSYTRTYAGV